MQRMENNRIFLDSLLQEELKVKEGDYFEQKILKDGSILFSKVGEDKLKSLIQTSILDLTTSLERLGEINPTSELYGFLCSLKEKMKEVQLTEAYESVPSYDFYLPLDKDLLILKAIYEGENTLSGLATALNLPSSSVSDSLNMLHTHEFIEYNKINDGKRGRPKHIYYLTMQGEQFCSEEF